MTAISISLTENEAIVLFEMLSRYCDAGLLGIEDQAEQRALWTLLSLLENQLISPFRPEYRDLLLAARDVIRDDGGTNAATEATNGRTAFWLEPADIAFIVDEWRKIPETLPDADRKRWADIAFRGMSALQKAGIKYHAKASETCYREVPKQLTGDQPPVELTS
jgi:hypothetical protein